jgi:predicted AAA+ superfamily ATPase
MNTIQDEQYSQLLNQLLDGELEQSSEAVLYSELANNNELRSEFRDLLKIKNSIKHDNEAFTTPLNTTTALFSSLGFSSVLTNEADAAGTN